MDINVNKLLDDCVSLENTISILIKDNASKRLELNSLQTTILNSSQSGLDQLVDHENVLRNDQALLKSKKDGLDINIKQLTDVNEKLNELVSVSQKANNGKKDTNNKFDEVYMNIAETIREYEDLRLEYIKAGSEIAMVQEDLEKDAREVSDVVNKCIDLVTNLDRNDNIIRMLDQQNKYAEQQFDLILNQLPWEPLTDNYIEGLCNSKDESIRTLARLLQMQTSEIDDLNESLTTKKQRKLDILEHLANQLNNFVKRREEAILMEANTPTGFKISG